MMLQIDFQQVRSDLPHLLDQVQAGDTLILCKDQKPIAEIRSVNKRRPVGLGKSQITLAPDRLDLLPGEIRAVHNGIAHV